jgi:hypothetical protein
MVSDRRDIGPLGTASRLAAGLVAIAVPVASTGIGWWDWAALNAFAILSPVVARVVLAGYERWAPDAFGSRHLVLSAPACSLIAILLALAVAVSAVTPADGDVVFWVWLGASMLVAGAAGYGGCEVLAFPNIFTGRRDRIGCVLFTPIDTAEARYRARRAARGLAEP